jgi:thymidylate kinase
MTDDHLAPSRSWPMLIAIEGPSGSGKSTLLRALESELASHNVPFCVASNNDSGLWSGLIRSLADRPQARMALALATAGARADLREGADLPILCDRYVLSTFVYQRFVGVPFDYLYAVNQPLLKRSVTFALCITPSLLAKRRNEQQSARRDWFKKTLDIREEVRLYEEATSQLKQRDHDIRTVLASDEVDALVRKLAPEITRLLDLETSG